MIKLTAVVIAAGAAAAMNLASARADPDPAVGSPCNHAEFGSVTTSNTGTTIRCYGVADPAWYRWQPDVGYLPNPHDVGNGMDY